MSFLLGLIQALFGGWLSSKKATAESLGQAEEKASVAQTEVDTLNREAAAAAQSPADATAMEKLLQDGKL